MATVKVKFRASTVEGKEGTLYYHLTHQRIIHDKEVDGIPYTINEANERIIQKIRLSECNEN